MSLLSWLLHVLVLFVTKGLSLYLSLLGLLSAYLIPIVVFYFAVILILVTRLLNRRLEQ